MLPLGLKGFLLATILICTFLNCASDVSIEGPNCHLSPLQFKLLSGNYFITRVLEGACFVCVFGCRKCEHTPVRMNTVFKEN